MRRVEWLPGDTFNRSTETCCNFLLYYILQMGRYSSIHNKFSDYDDDMTLLFITLSVIWLNIAYITCPPCSRRRPQPTPSSPWIALGYELNNKIPFTTINKHLQLSSFHLSLSLSTTFIHRAKLSSIAINRNIVGYPTTPQSILAPFTRIKPAKSSIPLFMVIIVLPANAAPSSEWDQRTSPSRSSQFDCGELRDSAICANAWKCAHRWHGDSFWRDWGSAAMALNETARRVDWWCDSLPDWVWANSDNGRMRPFGSTQLCFVADRAGAVMRVAHLTISPRTWDCYATNWAAEVTSCR